MYNDIKISDWLNEVALETKTNPKKFRFFGLNATIQVRRKGGTWREQNSKSHLSVHMLGESIWDGERLGELIDKLEARMVESMPDRDQQVKQVFNKFRKDQWA